MSDASAPVFGVLTHTRQSRVETFDSAGAPDQVAGTTPGGMRSVPSGVSATVVEPSNFSTGGAPDQRGGDVGAIPAGFALPTDDVAEFEAALVEIRRVLDRVSSAVEERGPDRDLARFRGSIRPAVETTVQMWDERAKSHYADPARNRFKAEALQQEDRAFEERRAAALDALQVKLAQELTALESARYERAPGIEIEREHDDKALRLAAELSHLSPATGLSRVGEFLHEAIEDPALAFVGRRFLREIFQRPGTPWTRNAELYRCLTALDQIVEAHSAVGGSQTEDIGSTRTELDRFFDALRDPVAGRFALGIKASGTGRAGDAPAFFPDEQVAAPAGSGFGDVPNWRPHGGKIPRGRTTAVADDDEA